MYTTNTHTAGKRRNRFQRRTLRQIEFSSNRTVNTSKALSADGSLATNHCVVDVSFRDKRIVHYRGLLLPTEVSTLIMMDSKKAYFMGYRHIVDLAAMNRIVDLVDDNRFNEYALELMQAWREGAIAAQAMIEKESATIQ